LPLPDSFFFKKNKISSFYRVTKPGGYVEITESINNFNDEGPIVRKLSEGRKC